MKMSPEKNDARKQKRTSIKVYWRVLFVLATGVFAFLLVSSGGASQTGAVSAQGPDDASELVVVGLSPPVWSLPITPAHDPSQPFVEVNPRQRSGYVPSAVEDQTLDFDPQVSAQNSTRTPAPMLNFRGMTLAGAGSGYPPDTVGDVGPNHYIQMVNSSFAIYNKSGTLVAGPSTINSLWPNDDNTKCEDFNDGDPIVLYDRAADRWLMTQFGLGGGAPRYQCIAISQTPDPTGVWYTYSFEVVTSGDYNDYGKMAVWPDGYYMGANENGFTAYVFERSKMLTGDPTASFQKINLPGQNFMLPSDLDGATAPPVNSPNYFYTMLPGNIIEVWKYTVDWDTPGNSTFVKQVPDLTSSGFIYDVCPADPAGADSSFDCIAQMGTATTLDAIGEWPMYRFQYRNHGTHESLVGNFTVDTNPATADQAAVHWFELRRTGGAWSIYQEGTISPDNHERWMGSAAMDMSGNIAVGYSVSSSTMKPEIRYATRTVSDTLGTMGSEVTLHASTDVQEAANRWGDYSSMNVDPVDDCTFWYTNEYVVSPSGFWETRIGTFKVATCGIVYTDFLYLPLVVKNN